MAKLIKQTVFVSEITNEIIADQYEKTTRDPEMERDGIEKCKSSPYYFYTHYFMVNGNPATTILTEQDFNNQFNKLKSLQ